MLILCVVIYSLLGQTEHVLYRYCQHKIIINALEWLRPAVNLSGKLRHFGDCKVLCNARCTPHTHTFDMTTGKIYRLRAADILGASKKKWRLFWESKQIAMKYATCALERHNYSSNENMKTHAHNVTTGLRHSHIYENCFLNRISWTRTDWERLCVIKSVWRQML